MSKPKLLQSQSFLKPVKPSYLLGLALISAVTCVFALRANNEHMISLRNAVYAADKSGTNVALALQNLQAYVTTHMNTDLSTGNGSIYPPIQLKYTYERLLGEEGAQAASTNSQLYTAAQNYCQTQIPNGFSGRYRVPCIEQYVESHDANLPSIPTSLYEFNFASPKWSPDLAGWTMLIAIVLGLLGLVKLIYDRLVLKRLKA